jgi:hypothetical protein
MMDPICAFTVAKTDGWDPTEVSIIAPRNANPGRKIGFQKLMVIRKLARTLVDADGQVVS